MKEALTILVQDGRPVTSQEHETAKQVLSLRRLKSGLVALYRTLPVCPPRQEQVHRARLIHELQSDGKTIVTYIARDGATRPQRHYVKDGSSWMHDAS